MSRKKVAGIGLAVVIVLVAGGGLAATKSAGKEPDFRAMQAEVDKAWCSLRAENAAPFYAKGPDNVFFDATPLKYQGWAEYQAGAQKLFLDGARSMKFIPKGDDRVTRSGDVAWMTRTLRLSADMKEGKPLEIDCRDTVLWIRQGGKWLIAHEHVSVPLKD
jgi:ketosteroid isomerase-like protein